MPTEGRIRPKVPLFEQFTLEQLTILTPYSEAYLDDLARGNHPIRPRFRRVVTRLLGKPEDELFGSDVPTPTNGSESGQTPTSEKGGRGG